MHSAAAAAAAAAEAVSSMISAAKDGPCCVSTAAAATMNDFNIVTIPDTSFIAAETVSFSGVPPQFELHA
jgi:hypothetical protein